MPSIIDISELTYLNSNNESKKTANAKRDRRDAILLSLPCVQMGMTRSTIEKGPAFLCRPAKLLCQWIIDLLSGIIALGTAIWGWQVSKLIP